MSRRRSKKRVVRSLEAAIPVAKVMAQTTPAESEHGLPPRYVEACRLAEQGKYAEARATYEELRQSTSKTYSPVRSLIDNDLAALLVAKGKLEEARDAWQDLLARDPGCRLTQLNRDLVEAEISLATVHDDFGELKLAPAPGQASTGAGPMMPALGPGLPTSPLSGQDTTGLAIAANEAHEPFIDARGADASSRDARWVPGQETRKQQSAGSGVATVTGFAGESRYGSRLVYKGTISQYRRPAHSARSC
jgi:hypothetical protein